jgi:hypothetical protein
VTSPSETRRLAVEAAETKAAHAAAEVYMNVLREELGKLGEQTVMGALGSTTHAHAAIVEGEAKGVVTYAFVFDDSPEAKRKVLELVTGRGIG